MEQRDKLEIARAFGQREAFLVPLLPFGYSRCQHRSQRAQSSGSYRYAPEAFRPRMRFHQREPGQSHGGPLGDQIRVSDLDLGFRRVHTGSGQRGARARSERLRFLVTAVVDKLSPRKHIANTLGERPSSRGGPRGRFPDGACQTGEIGILPGTSKAVRQPVRNHDIFVPASECGRCPARELGLNDGVRGERVAGNNHVHIGRGGLLETQNVIVRRSFQRVEMRASFGRPGRPGIRLQKLLPARRRARPCAQVLEDQRLIECGLW